MQITYTINEISDAVKEFWQKASTYRIIAFSGDLGAGKTTFISALCQYLGVSSQVSSPTFALINQYEYAENRMPKIIYHTDWYRLKDEEEAIQAGMEDIVLQADNYCFIEWPEKAIGLLPLDALKVYIELIDETTRRLTTQL